MIESPYSGDIDRNIRYLNLCIADAGLLRNEVSYASHLAMTQHPRCKKFYVSDFVEKWNVLTREQAIDASQRVRRRCDKTVFYTDLGWSGGMNAAKFYCTLHGLPQEERKLDVDALAEKVPAFEKKFVNAIISGEDYKKFLE